MKIKNKIEKKHPRSYPSRRFRPVSRRFNKTRSRDEQLFVLCLNEGASTRRSSMLLSRALNLAYRDNTIACLATGQEEKRFRASVANLRFDRHEVRVRDASSHPKSPKHPKRKSAETKKSMREGTHQVDPWDDIQVRESVAGAVAGVKRSLIDGV